MNMEPGRESENIDHQTLYTDDFSAKATSTRYSNKSSVVPRKGVLGDEPSNIVGRKGVDLINSPATTEQDLVLDASDLRKITEPSSADQSKNMTNFAVNETKTILESATLLNPIPKSTTVSSFVQRGPVNDIPEPPTKQITTTKSFYQNSLIPFPVTSSYQNSLIPFSVTSSYQNSLNPFPVTSSPHVSQTPPSALQSSPHVSQTPPSASHTPPSEPAIEFFNSTAVKHSKPDVAVDSVANKSFNSTPLIIGVSVGVVVILALAIFAYKKLEDVWSRRHYDRMDFLIDGMYDL